MPPLRSCLYSASQPARRLVAVACTALALGCTSAFAQADPPGPPRPGHAKANESAPEKPSPWIFAPVFSSNPKLGTALGAMAGYVHLFGRESRPSMFAFTAQYSNTGSLVAGAFARTSFDADHQRLNAAFAFGNVRNDYEDYLGTGVPLRNNAELKSFIGRYLYRVRGNWFLGAQAIYQNFGIAGETTMDEAILDILGVAPYKSGGLGVVGYYDSRDNDFKPTRGTIFSLNNLAYRESLGGIENFDVYRVDFRRYVPYGDGNVFAFRQLNHLTHDAPTQNLSPVQLRGYKVGQYTGEYMSQIEGEMRLKLADRWTSTLFAGMACTYGQGKSCSDSTNLFPMAGAGVQYVLKPEIGIVLSLEYAQGKAGNRGLILKTGYSF